MISCHKNYFLFLDKILDLLRWVLKITFHSQAVYKNVNKSSKVFKELFHVQSLILQSLFASKTLISVGFFPHNVVCDFKCWKLEM